MSLQIQRIQILASNSTAGADGDAFTYIQPKGFCRHVEITECPPPNFDNNATPFAPQGLSYKLGSENFVNTYGLVPGDTILIDDRMEEGNSGGRIVGHPQIGTAANNALGIPASVNYNPATIMVKIASATTTATWVLVKEYS